MPDPIDLSAVRPGDVLLHMGRGEISKLIAWASDSGYSHAALVFDPQTVAEAVSVGVRKTDLGERAVDRGDFTVIDVLRFGGAGAGLDPAALSALQAQVNAFIGAPYPLDELFELGVVCALRSKLDWPEPAKWFLRVVLDHVIHTDPGRMVCSEFVYRSFAEAATAPAGRLRPRIEVIAQAPTPFPHIDWLALLKEYEEARHRSPSRALPPAPTSSAVQGLQARAIPPAATTPDTDIAAQAEQIRSLRAGHALRGVTSMAAIEDPWPNPATVTPADLANSPSFGRVGRLLQSA